MIKLCILENYIIEGIDKCYDGIQAISFTHKISRYKFAIINCYLPPSNSIYGRNATSFMAHLLSIIYKIAKYDAVYILGDLNSRIGDKIDFVCSIDHIQDRYITDTTTNSHGEVFLDSFARK